MIALGKTTPYLVTGFFWLAMGLGAVAAFGLGGVGSVARVVASLLAVAILVGLATAPYYLVITDGFVWRSLRFGAPLVRLEDIGSLKLDGRTLESPKVGPLLYVAKNGVHLSRGGDLTDDELAFARRVAKRLGARLKK